MKFEYKIIETYTAESTEKEINEYATAGWEPVNISISTWSTDSGGEDSFFILLRRPLKKK